MTATELNAEISTQNALDWYVTDIKFLDADNAFLTFVKTNPAGLGYDPLQHVNAVNPNQTDINTDLASEWPDGYEGTGTFTSPSGTLFIMYQLVNPPSV